MRPPTPDLRPPGTRRTHVVLVHAPITDSADAEARVVDDCRACLAPDVAGAGRPLIVLVRRASVEERYAEAPPAWRHTDEAVLHLLG